MSYPIRCSPGTPLHGADHTMCRLAKLFPAAAGIRLSFRGQTLPIPITDHALPPMTALEGLHTVQPEAA